MSTANGKDGVFPGLRKLNLDLQVKVIALLYSEGFFGTGLTLEEVTDTYSTAPLLTRRMRCVMPEMAMAAGAQCKWPMKDVTYYQRMELPGLSDAMVQQAYDEACHAWNKVCGIRLIVTPSGELINIDAHSDYIDGSSGTLAYSYLPCNASQNSTMGQVYDDRESWSYNWLLEVAMHEVGHAIGLDHSPDPNALMYPYSHGGSIIMPQEWDIEQAVARYGPPVDVPDPPPVPEGGNGTGVVVIDTVPHRLLLKRPGSPGPSNGVFIFDGEPYEVMVLT